MLMSGYFLKISLTLLLIIIGAVVAVGCLGMVGSLLFFARKIFRDTCARPFPKPIRERSPIDINQDTIYGRGQNWFYSHRLEFQDLRIHSYDRLELAAYYKPARDPQTNTLVVLVHGWKDNPSIMGAFAQMYLSKMDCHILIPHLRGHGMSEGEYIYFGLADSQDILMWTEYLENKLGYDLKILYHGWSMGAATAIMAAGSGRLSYNVIGLVADSSYDDFEQQMISMLQPKFKIFTQPLIWLIDFKAKKHLGYSFKKIRPIQSVKKIKIPILFVHGLADDFVLPQRSEHLYRKTLSPKRLFLVENATHVASYNLSPTAYESSIHDLLYVCQLLS